MRSLEQKVPKIAARFKPLTSLYVRLLSINLKFSIFYCQFSALPSCIDKFEFFNFSLFQFPALFSCVDNSFFQLQYSTGGTVTVHWFRRVKRSERYSLSPVALSWTHNSSFVVTTGSVVWQVSEQVNIPVSVSWSILLTLSKEEISPGADSVSSQIPEIIIFSSLSF